MLRRYPWLHLSLLILTTFLSALPAQTEPVTVSEPAWAGEFTPASANGVRDQYLVLLAEGVARRPHGRPDLPTVADVARSLAAGHGGQVLAVWEHALPGFLLRMPEGRARALARDPRVRTVEQDSNVSAPVGDCYDFAPLSDTRTLPSPTASPQSLSCSDPDPQNDTGPGSPLCQDNWGIDRIDAATVGRDQLYHFNDNGTGVHAYVMDVGIDGGHREFLGENGVTRVGGGATIDPAHPGNPPSTSSADWFDCTSHGTHVAGIIGGRTYGVAKNVSIHPVKIFKCPNGPSSTVGTISSAAAGLNWVAANRILPAVLSWSGGNFGGWQNSPTIQVAVEGVINSGVIVVQSAGNQSPSYDPSNPSQLKDACAQSIGGLVDEVIVVGGSDENDGRWTRRPGDPRYQINCVQGGDCGSNAGACIDIWAPAAHVVSAAWQSFNQYCRLSGTSMAAPHVAGSVALYLQDHPNASVAEVTNALRSRGTWGALNTNPNNPNWIGPGSDNVLLYSRIQSVGPDLPPKAGYAWSCPGRRCSFNASASTDDFGIASYSWNFGDGSLPGSGVTTTHVFPAFTQSRVHLTVTDGLGRTDNDSEIVQAGPDLPPTANFTYVCSNRTCAFNAASSTDDDAITTYSWTFGDGGTGSGATPSHPYAATAFFSVTLTVADTIGQTASTTRSVGASIFADVPPDFWARPQIEAIYSAGVTAGCGTAPLTYCPETSVTRAQMAIFLLKAKEGSGYVPPPATCEPMPRFNDVTCDGPYAFYAPWIEELADRGITVGCGSGNYCPGEPVTRDQMALFLLKTKEGSGYVPPPATCEPMPRFNDVPCTNFFAPWIEELADRGITTGCGEGNYCPGYPVTRAQMAIFLTKTFNIPVP